MKGASYLGHVSLQQSPNILELRKNNQARLVPRKALIKPPRPTIIKPSKQDRKWRYLLIEVDSMAQDGCVYTQ
jgi:hypothetical protein